MTIEAELAAKVTPFVLDGLESHKQEIKATLPVVQRMFFPVVWLLLIQLVPGIISSIINYILNHRSELKL